MKGNRVTAKPLGQILMPSARFPRRLLSIRFQNQQPLRSWASRWLLRGCEAARRVANHCCTEQKSRRCWSRDFCWRRGNRGGIRFPGETNVLALRTVCRKKLHRQNRVKK